MSSAIGMDKEQTKKLLIAAGLEVADAVVLRHGRETLTDAEKARLGLPVFVKPAHGGSSLGVSRVDDWSELPAAVARARETEDKILVEAGVIGREVDLAVLEHPDGRVLAGPPLEIRVTAEHEFFDYEAKYSGEGSEFEIPANLPPDVTAELAEQAVRVFETLDCVGLLRVDFFLRDGVQPVVNEVNTLPGLTPHSQFPQIWQAAGVSYADLLDILITTAIVRRGRLDRRTTSAQFGQADRAVARSADRLPGSVTASQLL
jgi:D-alanine-D-alanine ligase